MPVKSGELTSKIELWEGYEVAVDHPELINDFDYITDLDKAYREKDAKEVTAMLFALIGGEKTFNLVREHIIEERGYFDYKALAKIVEKLQALFPKESSASQKRW